MKILSLFEKVSPLSAEIKDQLIKSAGFNASAEEKEKVKALKVR